MTGCHNGFAVRLQRVNAKIVFVWCVAHKLALVAHWASKAITYLVSYEEIAISIYNFFQYSAVRYNKLKELKNLMNQKVSKMNQKRIKNESNASRNLPRYGGCQLMKL